MTGESTRTQDLPCKEEPEEQTDLPTTEFEVGFHAWTDSSRTSQSSQETTTKRWNLRAASGIAVSNLIQAYIPKGNDDSLVGGVRRGAVPS